MSTLGEGDRESDGMKMMMMLELESRGTRDHDEVEEKSQSAKGDWVRRTGPITVLIRYGTGYRHVIVCLFMPDGSGSQ